MLEFYVSDYLLRPGIAESGRKLPNVQTIVLLLFFSITIAQLPAYLKHSSWNKIWWYSSHVNINILLYSGRYFNTNWQLQIFKRGKANGYDTCSVYFKIRFLILVTYVVGAHWNCLIEAIPMYIYNICQFSKWVFVTINFCFKNFSTTF